MAVPCTAGRDDAAAAQVVDAPCLDDLLADPELLALEFEAIIAANYPASLDRPDPRPPTGARAVGGRRTPEPWHGGFPDPGSGRDRVVCRRRRARQRGPPAEVERYEPVHDEEVRYRDRIDRTCRP